MKLRKMHWFGIFGGVITLLIGLVFFLNSNDINLLFFIIGIAFAVISLPFVFNLVLEGKREQEISSMFLEFSRNLAESVSTGTPVSKSIINMRKKNYGPLSPYVQKLANQIELGIPVSRALETFANDVDSPVIRRAVSLIREAERAGGEIDYILESVAKSISEVEKLKKERKAAVYNLMVQGYIIFFIFICIMLVMEFKIIPLTEGLGELGSLTGGLDNLENAELGSNNAIDPESLTRPFLYLLLAQGLFAGLTIGKLAEGTVKSGIKHSFILMISAFLISTGARILLN